MDNNNRRKKEKARKILQSIDNNRSGVISTQVLQEFYVIAVNKLNIDPLNSKKLINSFDFLETVIIDIDKIKSGIDISILNRISFWDALIISAAYSAKCDILWTEDLNPDQVVQGVKIVNPF